MLIYLLSCHVTVKSYYYQSLNIIIKLDETRLNNKHYQYYNTVYCPYLAPDYQLKNLLDNEIDVDKTVYYIIVACFI